MGISTCRNKAFIPSHAHDVWATMVRHIFGISLYSWDRSAWKGQTGCGQADRHWVTAAHLVCTATGTVTSGTRPIHSLSVLNLLYSLPSRVAAPDGQTSGFFLQGCGPLLHPSFSDDCWLAGRPAARVAGWGPARERERSSSNDQRSPPPFCCPPLRLELPLHAETVRHLPTARPFSFLVPQDHQNRVIEAEAQPYAPLNGL